MLLKIIVVLIVIGILQKIYEVIAGSIGRKKISEQIDVNPELALQIAEKNLESNAFTLDEYENYLIKIAEGTGYIDAIVKLAELYKGKKYKKKRNEEKYLFWMRCAVKAGNVKSIIEYYGFSDYDVLSKAYDEMICNLDKVRASSQNELDTVSYLKGIVNYKKGLIEQAKKLFVRIFSPELEQKSKYMLFRCFVREINITAAEKVLDYLEKNKFEIPAVDYLNLYNYYVAKRDTTEPDYKSEMKYAEKYATSKEADYKITCKIGGSTYYNVAIAMEYGRYDFEKDIEGAFKIFMKAADLGHMESLYYIGMSFWTGEFRDYHKANEYLIKAAQKGHDQSRAILRQCGVDGILIAPMRAEEVIYHFMDGYELRASGDIIKWLSLFYGIQYKATTLADEFSDKYKNNFKSFKELVNGIHQLYAEQIVLMLEWGIRLLMSAGIDVYDAKDIINESENLALLPRIPLFERALEKIDDRAAELSIKTAYAQATRGSWNGTGFGTTINDTIRASIQASVVAGAMNIGSGILHGVGDSIVEAMNNSEIESMGKKVFENPDTIEEFNNAVLGACLDVGNVLRRIIETHCDIKLNHLEGIIKFGDEDLADIDERTLSAKINNNLSVANNEYAYALLIEKLRRHPLDKNIMDQILMLTICRGHDSQEYKEVFRYACDFGLEGYSVESYNSINAAEKEI